MAEMLIKDTETMPWQSGIEVIESMAEEWRKNLGGPEDMLLETFAKHRQKTLRIDPATGHRVDLVDLAPGYADLTAAYHESAEECLVLEGECYLNGEGPILEGEYFWRPPGWVHSAFSKKGMVAIMCQEGVADDSGPVTRRICPAEMAGTNVLHAGESLEVAIGRRGWVRRLDTRLLPWVPGFLAMQREASIGGLDSEHWHCKVLSRNAWTDAQSLLVKLDPGCCQTGSWRSQHDQEFFVLSGSLRVGDTAVRQGGYVYQPAGVEWPPIISEEGATLFLKKGAALGTVGKR